MDSFPKNIVEVFQRIRASDKPFFVTDQTLTYGQLIDRTSRLNTFYKTLGLAAGDKVILATRHDPELVVLFLSLLRNGVTAIIVDPETKAGRFKGIVDKAEPKAVFIDPALIDEWRASLENRTVLEIKVAEKRNTLMNKLLKPKADTPDPQSYPALLDALTPMDGPSQINENSVAYILFTSGTTSEPKGVQITHKNLFAHLATLSRQFGYTSDARILNILPLDHTDGLVQGPMVTCFNGATVYRPLKFSIPHLGRLLDSIYTHRITHWVTVPTVLALVAKLATGYEETFRSKDFRFVISAAAYLEPELWETFEKRFHTTIANVYGLTETVTGGLFSGPSDKDHRIGTIGKPVDCEARIVDDQNREVTSGETGEIVLKGDHVMPGYCNAPEESAKVLRDGWLYTGDLGFVDAEGFFRVVGRKKSMIKSGGMAVSPLEVTEIMNRHPDVLETAVIGSPDPIWGEVILACVVWKPGVPENVNVLMDHTKQHLEEYKLPSKIVTLQSLPKGPSGKVRLDELRAMVKLRLSQEATRTGPDTETIVLQTAAECFHTDGQKLSLQNGPDDLTGWDSLAHMEFVTALEKNFEIKLSTAEIMKIEKLEDALAIVRSKLA